MMPPERLELQTQSLQIIGYGFWGTLKYMSMGEYHNCHIENKKYNLGNFWANKS